MAKENTPMSIVAVPAWQLSPTLFQTRSFGILFWDSDLILRRSKLCGRAIFAEEQTPLLRRSARVALFLTSIRPSLSNLASHALHISDRAIPIERIRMLPSFTAIPELIRSVKDGRKGPNVRTELVPEP